MFWDLLAVERKLVKVDPDSIPTAWLQFYTGNIITWSTALKVWLLPLGAWFCALALWDVQLNQCAAMKDA